NLIIRTKSVEFMPFYLSLSTFLMSVSFFAIPNGVGTLLGIVQLLLYFYYKGGSVEDSLEPMVVSYALDGIL
ncbi:SWEET sugar transporter, partial [Dillenia turbinata]